MAHQPFPRSTATHNIAPDCRRDGNGGGNHMRRNSRSEAGQAWQHLYKTGRWQRLRRVHLTSSPLCVMCLEDGRIEPATVVDHIKRHGGDEAKFFDSDNLQSLCSTHHNSVKQSEERTGKPIRRVGPDGWPIE